jgi:hypothetical protein
MWVARLSRHSFCAPADALKRSDEYLRGRIPQLRDRELQEAVYPAACSPSEKWAHHLLLVASFNAK